MLFSVQSALDTTSNFLSSTGVYSFVSLGCACAPETSRTRCICLTIGGFRQNQLGVRIALGSCDCELSHTEVMNFFVHNNMLWPAHLKSYQQLAIKVHAVLLLATTVVVKGAAQVLPVISHRSSSKRLLNVCVNLWLDVTRDISVATHEILLSASYRAGERTRFELCRRPYSLSPKED